MKTCPKCKGDDVVKDGGALVEVDEETPYNICNRCGYRWKDREDGGRVVVI